MTDAFLLQPWAGDAFQLTWPVKKWDTATSRWIPCPLASVSSITTTARNEGTDAIVNSRNNQNVLNANNGTFVTGAFSFFFQANDTALVGAATEVDQESHQFRFTITLTDGTITTISVTLDCLARPAVSMPEPANIGAILGVFRNFINENNPNTVADALLYGYLQRGLAATNERTKYCVKDYLPADQDIGPLVADTADVDLPGAVNEILFVYLGTNPLTQQSFEYLQKRQIPVGVVESNTPKNYIQWGRKLYFDPPPNSAAVAATEYPWVRAWIKPPPFRLYGPYLLPEQWWDVACYWAAAEWYGGPYGNKSDLMKNNMVLFEARVGPMAEYYKSRGAS